MLMRPIRLLDPGPGFVDFELLSCLRLQIYTGPIGDGAKHKKTVGQFRRDRRRNALILIAMLQVVVDFHDFLGQLQAIGLYSRIFKDVVGPGSKVVG